MKRIQICVARLCFSIAALMLFGSLAMAQTPTNNEYPKVEIFAGFSALGENPREIKFSPNASVGRGYATPTGLEISVVRNWTRYIGLKGDFSAHFKNREYRGALTNCTPTCTTAIQDFQLKTRVFNFLAGPEFKARNRTRLTPFAHVLGGVGHTSANFTTTGPTFNLALQGSRTGFAAALGGGLDIRASKRVSFRGLIDYNPVFINDSTANRRDLVRISLGLLFH
jgi:opacity protein-like surface antigen